MSNIVWTRNVPDSLVHRYIEDRSWLGTTLDRVFLRHASERPGSIAVLDGASTLTYGEVAESAAKIARAMVSCGVGPGDVVSCQLPNRAEALVAHLGATMIGAITNPLLPHYGERDLVRMLSQINPSLIITQVHHRNRNLLELWEAIVGEVPSVNRVFVVDGHVNPGLQLPFVDYHEISRDEAHATARPLHKHRGREPTCIIFTSGTVQSKGVIHTHDTSIYGLDFMARALGLGKDTVVWMPSPVGHGTGFQWGMRLAMYVGGSVVLQDRWDPHAAYAVVQNSGATVTIGATTFVHDLVSIASECAGRMRSLEYFVCSGAPMPTGLGERVRELLGVELLGSFGMSEHFISTMARPDDPEHLRWSTDGRPIDGTEVAIVDDEWTSELPVGDVGELAIRGPGVCVGYVGDGSLNRETFRADGWMISGDLARLTDSGHVRITGRKKDIIIRGGLNVSPADVEEALFGWDTIQDAAVVGWPDERLGERICLFVVPSMPKSTLTLDQVVAYLSASGVPRYKWPERLELVEDLPRTPSGKLRRNVLRGLASTRVPYGDA